MASVRSVWDSAEEPTGSQEDHGQIPNYHITFWHRESTLKCWNYRFFASSLDREWLLANVRRTNYWRATSNWSCSCESLIAAGSCMRSTWSSAQRTAPHGSSSQSWRPFWETQTEPGPSLSSPSDSRGWTCQRCQIIICFNIKVAHGVKAVNRGIKIMVLFALDFSGIVEVLHRLWDRAGRVWKHQESLQKAVAAHSTRQGETVKLMQNSNNSERQRLVLCWLLPVPQVWISSAKFELSVEDPERLQRCRQVFEEANKSLRNCEQKEERLLLLESWRDFEREFGADATIERVRKLLPEKVKKRRKLTAEDGVRAVLLSDHYRI